MGETTIQWTDRTWNPVTGCDKISPGCKHCYAETVANRFWKDRKFTDVICHEDRLDQPLRWRKPQKVFVNSMSDLFHDDVPEEFITKAFSIMAAAEWHQFQILTKRPLRMFRYIESHKRKLSLMSEVWPIPNVWLGVSVENQEYADERIPLLAKTPAAIRFISYEPALGPIDIQEELYGMTSCGRPDWVIVGGESGPGAREFHVDWARSVVRQCQAAKVPVFVKQMGAYVVDRNDAGFEADWNDSEGWPEFYIATGRVEDIDSGYQGAPVRIRLKDRKGGDMAEWPADLRVREFPTPVPCQEHTGMESS